MTIEIKSWYTNRVLYSSDKAKDIKECLEEAVAAGANLQYAKLQSANLQDAKLQSANLQDANLQDANLQYANLQSANLQYAKLQSANLQDAKLQSANLQDANLQSANLQDAKLQSANLQDANLQSANLQYAKLQYANLQYANLQSANLQYAKLQSANLQYANLQSANLQDAKLQSANLQYAKLQYATGFNKYLVQPLLMLLDQPGKLRFYKCVTERLTSPTHTHMALTYDIGTKLSVDDADCDEYVLCGAGINVATLDWIMREYPLGGARYRIVIIECKADDIACVPVATDGKIRLHRGKVVGELDYERYGLTVPTFAGKTSKQVIGG